MKHDVNITELKCVFVSFLLLILIGCTVMIQYKYSDNSKKKKKQTYALPYRMPLT